MELIQRSKNKKKKFLLNDKNDYYLARLSTDWMQNLDIGKIKNQNITTQNIKTK